jgi:hypothetical protein
MPTQDIMVVTAQGEFEREYFAAVVLSHRDRGDTLQAIADYYGLATRQHARTFWIRGLRNAGRESEIQTRQIQMVVGGRRIVFDSNDLSDTFTFCDDAFAWTTFGAEIECYNAGYRRATSALRSQNLHAEQEGWNHETRPHWKVTSDGSIAGNSPCEVVSPVLAGNDGLREMRTAMMALRETDARVNSSCGAHIHIGINGWIDEEGQARIIERWWLVNRAMEMLVLPGRRNNRWCKRSSSRHCRIAAQNWRDGERQGQHDRYMDLNMQAWLRQGTFEVRLHNGSLNGKNHSAWVIFNQALMLWLSEADILEVEAIFGSQFAQRECFITRHRFWQGRPAEERMLELARALGEDVEADTAIMRNLRDSEAIEGEWREERREPSDDECEDACRSLIEVLRQGSYLKDDVAEYLNARLTWIKNRQYRRNQEA